MSGRESSSIFGELHRGDAESFRRWKRRLRRVERRQRAALFAAEHRRAFGSPGRPPVRPA